MALETFANMAATTVNTPGGTGAPAAGTVETWTVASSAAFPSSVTNISCFHVDDPQLPGEIFLVTNVSGTTWTVTRGAEGTTPAAHFGGFTAREVTTAGFLTREPDVPIGRITVCGHSYASGYLTSEDGEQWPQRLAASMHSELLTYCHSSSVLAVDDTSTVPGGYASVLNGIRPRAASGFSYVDRTAAPFMSLSPVTVFEYGVNDLAYLTATTATNVAWFKMALRAVTCVARAGGIFADTNASVAYGGSGGSHWSANIQKNQRGSPTNHQTVTVNDTVTITVPAVFPGGEVDILTLAFGGGTKWSTTVDGGAAQVLDGTGSAFGSSASLANLVVQRFTGLAAGTHTIIATVAAIDGSATAMFDSWLIAAPSLPLTVLCTEMAGAPAFPLTRAGPHTVTTTADVNALNAAILALPAEFTDGMVVPADINAYFGAAAGYTAYGQPGSLFQSDNWHPNQAGSAVIAQCVRDAIRGAPLSALPPGSTWRGVALYPVSGLIMRQIQGPGSPWIWPAGGEPGLTTNWSFYFAGAVGNAPAGAGAYFTRDSANQTEINLSLINTSSPAVGSTIFTLPPGYQPENPKMLTAVSWNVGQTVATIGQAAVFTNGNVVWYSGSPATRLDIYGSYQANGLGQ